MNPAAPVPYSEHSFRNFFDQLKESVVEDTKKTAREFAPRIKEGRAAIASIVLADCAFKQFKRKVFDAFPPSYKTHVDQALVAQKRYYFAVCLQQQLSDIFREAMGPRPDVSRKSSREDAPAASEASPASHKLRSEKAPVATETTPQKQGGDVPASSEKDSL